MRKKKPAAAASGSPESPETPETPLAVGDSVVIRGTIAELHPGGNVVILTEEKIDTYPAGTRINLHISQVDRNELEEEEEPEPEKAKSAS